MSPAAARHLPREPSWGDFHSATPTPPSEQGRGGSGSGGLGEDDLLGSFDDLLHDSPAPESASRAAHHDHPSRRSTPKDTPEHDLINLDTDAHGDVVPRRDDPHLQLYEGPSAELPPAPGPASASARGTVPASVSATASTSSTSSLHRQRSSRARGTAIPHPHPPRRMSTIDALASLAGPSSPAALSPEVGNSFIFRAHAHDESGSGYAPAHAQGYSHAQCSGPGAAEDAQTGMRRLSAQLSTSPTRSLSLSLSSMSLGHAVPPAAGSVGHFPKKRTSAEGLRGRGREGEGQGQEGRDSGQSVAGAGPASSHTRAATDPWAVFGEAEHGGRSAGAEGSELASGATSTSAPGWKQGAATLGAKATQGIKSKWKTVLGPGTFTPSRFDAFAPSSSAPGGPASLGGFSQRELDAPSATAAPIETTHHTPFARHSSSWLNYRLAPGAGAGPGSYVPPSGAPGFVPAHADADGNGWGGRVEDVKEKGEWSGTRLLGRREGTYEVLDADAADAVRGSVRGSTPRARADDSAAAVAAALLTYPAKTVRSVDLAV